ncbi:MAG: hypothetical protein F6K24_31630, partial [Okeania sp. SIO2D1]|nr:hypothetical protein [Okeania sp. SIO2D1]
MIDLSENQLVGLPLINLPEVDINNHQNIASSSEILPPELEVQKFDTPPTNLSINNDPLTNISFIENAGQINNTEVEYLAKANNYDLLFAQDEIIFAAAQDIE